eukprot:gene11293-12532_t
MSPFVVLESVDPAGAAARAGCGRFVGAQLTRVNGVEVASNDAVAAAIDAARSAGGDVVI